MFKVKTIVSLGAFFLIFLLENLRPFFQRKRSRWPHDVRNIGIFIINSVVLSVIFSSITVGAIQYFQKNSWGIVSLLSITDPWRFYIVFVLFDLWMYIWHVLNHRVAFLWRFHRMHHSDPMLNVTSALRFHTGELILSSLVRLGVVGLLGMRLWDLILYESIMMPVIYLHHSSFNLPERLDTVLRSVIVTPRVHWVHHSVLWEETNSNYGTVFSWWDRLFRTFRLRIDPQSIEFGLLTMKSMTWQTLPGMLKTPFAQIPNEPPPTGNR